MASSHTPLPPAHTQNRTILPIVPNPSTDDECDPYLHPTLLYALHLPLRSPLWQRNVQKELVDTFAGHQCVFTTRATPHGAHQHTLHSLRGTNSLELRRWLRDHFDHSVHRMTSGAITRKKRGKRSSRQQQQRRSRALVVVPCHPIPATSLQQPQHQAFCADSSCKSLTSHRAIKTPREIGRMQKACDISCEAIRYMVVNAQSFTHTKQMLKGGLGIMRKRTHTIADCDTTAYTTILTLNGHGKHTTRTGIQRVHPTFENYPLHHHTKPLLLLDMGARYGGYCADITRTFSTTTPTNRQIDMYQSVLTLYELGESMVKPDVLYEDIDRAVKKQLEVELKRLGFADYTNTYKYMPHSLGHSVGIEVHDTPDIMSVGRLRPNMVLTIEPGIYTDEMDIRIENTIVVTDEGCRVLSHGVPWSMKWFCRGSR